MSHKQLEAVATFLLCLVQQLEGHGTMMEPVPRQPESLYWYQVGCMIGCTCSGGGKETYPTLESVNCQSPGTPTLTKPEELTWNAQGKSPMGEWNKYMPWRAPGTSMPLDACGIASGFLPSAKVQYAHKFGNAKIKQGTKGTTLAAGKVTEWLAGSVVKASYRLVVNHGGGYQYRVCPKTQAPTESCFQANPLAFANGKTTVEYKTGKKISLHAVDITAGVQPAGYAWRRLPLPACACDIGTNCQNVTMQTAKKGDNVAYTTDDSNKQHGHCEFGLQFEATHLKDGTWTDGFGYYVASLGDERNQKSDACGAYSPESTCKANAKSGCTWHEDKATCYTGKSSANPCSSLKTENACKASSSNCAWHSSKSICWASEGSKDTTANGKADTSKTTGFGGAGTKDGMVHQWWVTDELTAPSKLGDYILQWRWDNEQTPQVWTTCADIKVTGSTSTSSAALLKMRGAYVFLWLMLVEAVAMIM